MDNHVDTDVFLNRLFNESHRSYACQATTPEEVRKWAASARPALCKILGLDRIASEAEGFAPSVSFTGDARRLDGYTRRAGRLSSEPGVNIPFWFLRPDGPGPFPIGLFPHGHEAFGMDTYVGLYDSEDKRRKIEREDRDVAVQAVRRGMIAIAPTTRGFLPATVSDRTRRHDGRNCRSEAMHAFLAGRTATGERVWDMSRLLDWVATLPEADARRVLVMGNSGGGMVTTYMSACDERVSVAVPSCSFCSLASRDGNLHHCDCNAVPGILRWGEFWDVAGLIAPRHLLIVNGREDALFPLSEVDRAVAEVCRIFAAAGVPAHAEHRYGPGGHRFYKDLMWPFVERALQCEP